MSKVHIMDGPLRRPAIIAMAFGYRRYPEGDWQVFRVMIDDIVGMDWVETDKFVGIIGHLNHGS